MKRLNFLIVLIVLFFIKPTIILSQNNGDNIIIAEKLLKQVDSLWKTSQYDTALSYINKAYHLYLESTNDTNLANIACINYLGMVLNNLSLYDSALIILKNSLNNYSGKYINHQNIVFTYLNIGNSYQYLGYYDSSFVYYSKGIYLINEKFSNLYSFLPLFYLNMGNITLDMTDYSESIKWYKMGIDILEKSNNKQVYQLINYYINIGLAYSEKGDYQMALKYYSKCDDLFTKVNKTDNEQLAMLYGNIGILFTNKHEYIKSNDFHFKCLNIFKKLLGENHLYVGMTYQNIGNNYWFKNEYNLALEYYFKSLNIYKSLYGENHYNICMIYNNIGNIYNDFNKDTIALDYYKRSISMYRKIFNKHAQMAETFGNVGNLYYEKSMYDSALIYYDSCMQLNFYFYGKNGIETSRAYNNIGLVYKKLNKNMESLNYFEQGILSAFYFNDNSFNYLEKFNTNYNDYGWLLENLICKAQLLANINCSLDGFTDHDGIKTRYQIALRHYQACDTLINQVRKEISMLSDKIALGEKANQVYNEAVEVCFKLSKLASKDSTDYYKKLAFEYSEKNKSSVLLESIAGAEAMKFVGIPDSLLEKEHELQIDIALYKRLLSEQPDSAQEANFRDRLFKANRNYEELIQQFENNYPEYFHLKYGQNLANVSQLQQTLDKTTAIISYQETDSVLFVFYIEKNNYQIYTTPKRSNYQEIINVFRQSLVNTAPNNSGLYKAAYFLYKQLLPFTIESHIQNLIIIPEGSMCLIPFEALLTEEYKGNPEQYSNYAYLVKKYNISYAYSASLFYISFPKTPTKKVEVTQLNDWLAIAPVFDDVKTGGASFRTRQLLRDMEKIKTDTITTRAFMLTGEYITPLPGTEQEVKNIFNKFENKNKKALIQLHAYANEAFVKSEEIKKYKYLHFASHGIVNMQKPELSGIILAQDSASGEDGILYSGEIYNLKLNADLTVLSACETGLGEIKKGEGLIGLTRALLYAGSKNIIVSLWKVADNSTSQLMVDFYDILLKDEKNVTNYSSALRQAKLKMIAEGKYSHPFYWSPFILIGK